MIKKEKIVYTPVTITPSSPPEQKNRAAERCYIAVIIVLYFNPRKNEGKKKLKKL